MLKYGALYRITGPHVMALQFNQDRTDFVTAQDRPIPIGTIIQLGDHLELNPYSRELKEKSLNPHFYDVSLQKPVPGFESSKLVVYGHQLEKSVEEVEESAP